jgi:hypothetical protein
MNRRTVLYRPRLKGTSQGLALPLKTGSTSCMLSSPERTPHRARSIVGVPSDSHASSFPPPTSPTLRTSEENTATLPPIDRGWPAWRFIAASFVLDMFVSRSRFPSCPPCVTHAPSTLAALGRHLRLRCAFSNACESGHTNSLPTGTWQEYYLAHPPFSSSSPVALSAVGTTALALNYAEMLVGIVFCRRYPQYVRPGVWVCLIVYALSLVAASFATQVSSYTRIGAIFTRC